MPFSNARSPRERRARRELDQLCDRALVTIYAVSTQAKRGNYEEAFKKIAELIGLVVESIEHVWAMQHPEKPEIRIRAEIQTDADPPLPDVTIPAKWAPRPMSRRR